MTHTGHAHTTRVRSGVVMSGIVGLGVAIGAVMLIGLPTSAEDKPVTARSGIEMQLFDPRIPADERQVLDAAIGYGLPALPAGAAWVSKEQIDLSALGGQVIVIQSFTRGDADGRAAIRRTTDVVENLKLADVRVIGLHTPDQAGESAAFYAKRAPSDPTILDSTGALCDELGVYQRPVTILIDRNGTIRYSGVSMSKLRAAIEILAAEKINTSMARPKPLPPRAQRLDEAGAAAPEATPEELPPFPPANGAMRNARDVRGKAAPPIDRLVYLSGDKPRESTVVMVEFWATWCPPCVANIPHLNDLHKKFGETVSIVGVTKETEDKVRPFIKAKDMRYAVALDQGGGLNGALSIQGIPHAIIMSPDGIVRWQGHPGALDETTLQQIVDASGIGAGAAPAGPKRWVTSG